MTTTKTLRSVFSQRASCIIRLPNFQCRIKHVKANHWLNFCQGMTWAQPELMDCRSQKSYFPRMGTGIKGYLPILIGAKYLTSVNHILSYHNIFTLLTP